MTLFYEPFKPSTFVCQPAAALIISKGGEVEVFSGSKRCSAAITTFPKFAGIGRTSSLLDEELLLLGNDDFGTKGGRYVSIQKPRDGLLAMKYSIQNIPLNGPPHKHSSLVSKNTLNVIGGKFKSRGSLSKFTWTELALHWQNGTRFATDLSGSCAVKVGVDVHIVFGGQRHVHHQQLSSRQVVRINTTEQIVYKMTPMSRSRHSHGCALLTSSVALLSGGLDQSSIQPDELYDVNSGKVVTVLNVDQSLGRSQHALFRGDDRIFALGGKDSNNNSPSRIAFFNTTTKAWNEMNQALFSTNTSELLVTPFPSSALDCVPECRCGVNNRNGRIFGGSDAEVIQASRNIIKIHLYRQTLSPGLLLFCGMRTRKKVMSTANVVPYW